MFAHPAPKYYALPSRGLAAPPHPPALPVYPAHGLPPADDELHGWVGYESAHPWAWLPTPLIDDDAQVPI